MTNEHHTITDKHHFIIVQNRKKYSKNRHLIIHFPTSSAVSEQAYEWLQRSARAKRAGWSKRMSERYKYQSHSTFAAVSNKPPLSVHIFHFLSFKFYNFTRQCWNKIGKQYFFLWISHFAWQLLRYDFRLSILARNSLVSFCKKFRYSSSLT